MLFMHNGQVGNYARVRRAVESLIPDDLYPARSGTTDSEALFLAILARGAATDPVDAVASVLADIVAIQARAGVVEPLRFTAALTDGRDLFCFRFATDAAPPSLYFRESADGLLVVSEPLDDDIVGWHEVPAGHALTTSGDGTPQLRPFSAGLALAA
jgi:glutamine amidotransferase